MGWDCQASSGTWRDVGNVGRCGFSVARFGGTKEMVEVDCRWADMGKYAAPGPPMLGMYLLSGLQGESA